MERVTRRKGEVGRANPPKGKEKGRIAINDRTAFSLLQKKGRGPAKKKEGLPLAVALPRGGKDFNRYFLT